MRTPTMPSNLKSQLQFCFMHGDAEGVVELNKLWFKYVKDLRKQEQVEAQQIEKGESN